MYFIRFHWPNRSLSCELANVSESLATLNDGRLSKVVGMHRLTAVLMRDSAYDLYVRTSSRSSRPWISLIISESCKAETRLGWPSRVGFGSVAARWTVLFCIGGGGGDGCSDGRSVGLGRSDVGTDSGGQGPWWWWWWGWEWGWGCWWGWWWPFRLVVAGRLSVELARKDEK